MILSWILIGLITGSILGLSGAGGAVIAVPLFMSPVGSSLREATVLSLIVVSIGAAINWWIQRDKTQYSSALILFLFSVVGSFIAKPVKELSSDQVIIGLFLAVVFLSFVSVWKKKKDWSLSGSSDNKPHYLKVVFGGITFGSLVTLTGLGGGVVLVPLLSRLFSFTSEQITASSLFIIFLASMTSLALQFDHVANFVGPETVLALLVGSLISALFVRLLIKKFNPTTLDLVRRIVLSGVLLFSMLSVFSKF